MRFTIASPMFALAFFLGTSLLSVAAETKSDHDLIQGTWKVVSATQNGADMKDKIAGIPDIAFDGDKFSSKRDGKDEGGGGTFKLDSSAKPKQMDMTHDGDANKEHVLNAIYELDGDSLKICMSCEGEEVKPAIRPKDLTPQGHVILVLERKK